jgi:hypothetical protein
MVERKRVNGRDQYGNLTSSAKIESGTEYGGVDGVIQPPPHVANSREMLMQVYQTDPAAGAIKYLDGHTDAEHQPIPETKKIV